MSNKIQAAAAETAVVQKCGKTLKDVIKSMEGEIKAALPSVLTPERFTRIVFTAISSNPKLGDTTPKSFLGAMMNAAQLGVEPNTPMGQAYLIPFKNKGVLECQFQLGYKGMIDLARRSGDVADIDAQVVHENDEFSYEYGLHSDIKHIPALENRGEPICYYGYYKLKDGGHGFAVMSVEDVRNHAKKYSQAYSSSYSPWTKNFDEMAKKTVLKQALKYAPMKSDFAKQVVQDETIKNYGKSDIFDTQDSTDYNSIMSEDDENIIDVEGEVVNTDTGEVLENDHA